MRLPVAVAWNDFQKVENMESIVIRGRDPEIAFVEDLVFLDHYMGVFTKHRLASNYSIEGRDIPLRQSGDYLMQNFRGCPETGFNAKVIDEFTTEYFPGSCDPATGDTLDPFGKGTLPKNGFAVWTSYGYYGFRIDNGFRMN